MWPANIRSRWHLCPGLNGLAKIGQQIVFAILAKKIWRELLSQMYREIANKARITNSTRTASCSKNLSQKHMFHKNCSQKSKEVCKNRKSNKKFHCNQKYPDKYHKNNRNDKLSKSSGPSWSKARYRYPPDKSCTQWISIRETNCAVH